MTLLLVVFIVQLLVGVVALLVSGRIARARKPVWAGVCGAALAMMLVWPLMRVFPVAPIDLLGAPVVACIGLTGLAIPAALFFGVASRHVPRKSDQRAIMLLTVVAGLYFIKAGWWMMAPGVPDLGATRFDATAAGDARICRQTTGYTCVAASMVTMLAAHGIEAGETEMARLAFTQVNGGATDSRTLWALQRKLAGTALRARYERLDRAGIIAVGKPCMVQLDWGFFISHMVPVMAATPEMVVIGDPLNGRREITMDEFMGKWKGTAISLEAR